MSLGPEQRLYALFTLLCPFLDNFELPLLLQERDTALSFGESFAYR